MVVLDSTKVLRLKVVVHYDCYSSFVARIKSFGSQSWFLGRQFDLAGLALPMLIQ